MAITRDFADTIKARAERDPEFRKGLLDTAIESLLSGEVDVGQAMLRDFINATIGFEALAETTDINAKSLHRMLGPRGNPTARKLFPVLARLREIEATRVGAVR